MFKKTTWIFLLFVLIISLATTFALSVIDKNDQINRSQYYEVSNEQFNNITTIIKKEQWKQLRTVNILAKNKINGTFTAVTDYLGIISVPFNTHNKSINDKIIFRLKEEGKKDWYYQGTYNTNQFQNDIPFPFGFPIIKNSKNILYMFEIESLEGNNSEPYSLSKALPNFFTKYKFSKSELSNNPYILLKFLIVKTSEQLSLLTIGEIVKIFLLSIIPPFLLMILIAKSKGIWTIKDLLLKSSKKFIWELFRLQNIKIKEYERNDVLFGFLITFSIIAFIVLLTGILSSPLTGQRKWVPYLSILIPSFALGLNYLKKEWLSKGYILVIAAFLLSSLLTLSFISYGFLSWLGVSGALLIGCCIVIIPIMRYFSFVFVGTMIFLFGINSLVYINAYGWPGFIWAALVMVVILYTFLFSLQNHNHFTGWIRINKISFIVLLIISSLLALRSDSFSLGPSEYHWNYFTAVIQTLHSGGELLWSAPSQYGFLNILLPSLLPWTSRSSFYIFQAVLFFASTVIIIRTIYMCFSRSASFIFIALTSLSLFYFADPGMIGPTFYPSSSAVRFFCSYVLIYTALLEYKRGSILNVGVKWFVTGAYILGALWSAESFLTCTAIYAVYLFSSALSLLKLKGIKSAFRFLYINILVVLIAFIVFNLLYLAITRHFPDWSMYFMFVFNYANGFGEISIAPWGIHWAVIIVLSGIVFILWRLYSARKYNEWVIVSACFIMLWALTSYYVGRAATNNLTAVLPLIFYIFIIMSSVLIESKFLSYRLLLNAIFLPWVIAGVIGGFGNPQFIYNLPKFKYAEDVNSKSFKPDEELKSILVSLGALNGARIAYYGYPYNNPIISNKRGDYTELVAGMPIPLTLLEEPTSEQKREIIMQRFMNKINGNVFFIYQKNEGSTRLTSWKKFLEQKYSVEKKEIGSGMYGVLIIRRK